MDSGRYQPVIMEINGGGLCSAVDVSDGMLDATFNYVEGSNLIPEQKLAKLAAAVDIREALLVSPFREPEDSGIDSDEPSPWRAALTLQLSEESSSSDEDAPDEDWIMNKEGEPLKDMADGTHKSLDILIQWGQKDTIQESSICDEDRSSPPLYEVELTASDEDDDASVLELVIPMQSRYQRVPTSSPKKTKPKTSRFLSSLFCCISKK